MAVGRHRPGIGVIGIGGEDDVGQVERRDRFGRRRVAPGPRQRGRRRRPAATRSAATAVGGTS